MVGESPELNEDEIEYPSGALMLRSLRARGIKLDVAGEDLEVMHEYERDFAQLGFAIGLMDDEQIMHAKLRLAGWDEANDGPFEELVELQRARERLAQEYVRFGVADGMESAKQRIRRLEDDAVEQGRGHLRGRRP